MEKESELYGHLVMNDSVFELISMLDECKAMFREKATAKHVAIEIQVADLPMAVRDDDGSLKLWIKADL